MNNLALETLNQGAAVDRFNIALQQVFDNIQDPNTDPKKARTVTLKFTFHPNEDRDVANLKFDVVAGLAPIAPVETEVILGRDKNGKGFAMQELGNQAVDHVYRLEK
jgi:hypothetical protein